MTQILSTDPTLSVPAPEPIGRLYRMPGSEPLEQLPNGNVRVPNPGQLLEAVISGRFMPSITNVIGVLDKPHLLRWSSRKSLESLVEFLSKNPEENVAYLLSKRTEAIRYYAGAAERDRDAAAVRGTRVHEACEFLGLGKTLDELGYELNDDEMACVDSFKAWLDVWQPEFLANEVTVFGETPNGLKYAGTGDFIAKIDGRIVAGDYKTTRSGLHNEVSLQLTAVTRAPQITLDQQTLVPNFKVEAGIGVHLSPTGYNVRQASLSDEKWNTFCGLREAWTYQAFEGLTSPDDRALAGNIGRPDQLKF